MALRKSCVSRGSGQLQGNAAALVCIDQRKIAALRRLRPQVRILLRTRKRSSLPRAVDSVITSCDKRYRRRPRYSPRLESTLDGDRRRHPSCTSPASSAEEQSVPIRYAWVRILGGARTSTGLWWKWRTLRTLTPEIRDRTPVDPRLASSVWPEQAALNRRVVGSNPTRGTWEKELGWVLSRLFDAGSTIRGLDSPRDSRNLVSRQFSISMRLGVRVASDSVPHRGPLV